MDHYSVLIRNHQHEIREFPAELCRNPRNRRWICTGSDTEPRAVKNAKGILRKILKNFDGMMVGTVKPTTPKVLIPIVDKRPEFHADTVVAAALPSPIVALQMLERKQFKLLDINHSLSMGQKAHRTTFNAYVKECATLAFDLEQVEAQLSILMKDASNKRQMYAVLVEYLEQAAILDSKFAGVVTNFQLDIDATEVPEVSDVIADDKSNKPSPIKITDDLKDIFHRHPEKAFDNKMIREELEKRGKSVSTFQVSNGLTYLRSKGMKLIKVDSKHYRLDRSA